MRVVLYVKTYAWEKIDVSDVLPDFPKLIEVEIRKITLGIYQV